LPQPLNVTKGGYGHYLQLVDFFKCVAGAGELDPKKRVKKKRPYFGLHGLASFIDELLCFVAKNCKSYKFKNHRLDCMIFEKLYQELVVLRRLCPKFEPENATVIDSFVDELSK